MAAVSRLNFFKWFQIKRGYSMERLLIIFCLLFSFVAQGAQPGGPSVGIGQNGLLPPTSFIGFDQFTGSGNKGIFTLSGGNFSSNLGSNAGYHLYKNGVEEFVTTGVSVYCFNIVMNGAASTAAQLFITNTEFPNNSNPVPGTVKWQSGLGQGATVMQITTGGTWSEMPHTFTFDGPGYPGIVDAGANTLSISMQCFQQ